MQNTFYCPNCGSGVPYGMNFCNNCGARLAWQADGLPYVRELRQPVREKTAAPDWKFGLIMGIVLGVLALGGAIAAYGLLSPLPVISNVNVTTVTGTTAVITWTTDVTSTSQVEYGTTAQYGLQSASDQSSGTSHTVTLQGLSPQTNYHCRAKSQGANWHPAVSSDLIFTTK
jgi:hypothetical protein